MTATMMRLPDEFRSNHRAASESLLKAATGRDRRAVLRELDKARYFEEQAMRCLRTPRERALAMGLLHAVDLMRAVAEAEFGR